MRIGLLATAILALLCSQAPAADPPLPPIVFQSQPVGRILDDLRTGAKLVADEKGVKAFNDMLKEKLGPKGIEGLDLTRPVVGYVVLAPKPEDITAVVAIPVTGEKEFLDLCERANKQKPKLAGKEKDVYELPPLDPKFKALMRFQDRHAYIVYGARPEAQLDPKVLVSAGKLYDPNERGLIAARVFADRIPPAVKQLVPAIFEEFKKGLAAGGMGVGKQEMVILKPIIAEVEKLVTRYSKLAEDADSIVARVLLDAPSGQLTAEAALSGKPGTELARQIAAFKPTTNKFGSLLAGPDVVSGFLLRLPFFEEELRNVAAVGLEAAQKEGLNKAPDAAKPLLEELLKGLARTVKTGEFDIAGALRGPDKNGAHTAVFAIAFEDTAKLEKEIKTAIQKEAPAEIADAIKWDAAKAGPINIHTWKPNNAATPFDPTKVFGGDDCLFAFAFAPHGIFAAIGPDAIGTVKSALAAKPVAAPVFDVLVNPARLTKLIQLIAGEQNAEVAAIAEAILGKEDKLVSAMSIKLEGGKELKATLSMNLKLIPRAIAYTAVTKSEPPPPPVIRK